MRLNTITLIAEDMIVMALHGDGDGIGKIGFVLVYDIRS